MDNKAILISIKPKWCSLIMSGAKTVEVRRNAPNKVRPPFKCYIYCTKCTSKADDEGVYHSGGKVIGEFICDDIEYILPEDFICKEEGDRVLQGTCLTRKEIYGYLGLPRCSPDAPYKMCRSWQILSLKIYEQPKNLSDFSMTRAPQSWCYVKEKES